MLHKSYLMKKIALFILFHLVIFQVLEAQEVETDPVLKSEVSKLGFMEGTWKGRGWMMSRDGQRQEFEQTESVQFKLDHTLLLIEGQGQSHGQMVHNALAAVTYNKEEGAYTFTSWLANGLTGSYTAKLIGDRFHWYPNEFIRYILLINDQGQWYETGEMKRGEEWIQIFEMTLDKM